MALSDLILPVEVILVMCGVAITALLLMYRRGHNKTLLGIVLAEFWLFGTYFLFWLGIFSEAERVTLLRYGVFLLQFAIVIGSAVYILKHRRKS